jgi:hypothetical protein
VNTDERSRDGIGALSEQRALLDRLVSWEHELAVLRELESELEAEQIGADVALKAATSKHGISISLDDAEEIARARARKRELETALEGESSEASPGISDMKADIDRMRSGLEALEAWRDAPETVSAWRRPKVANTALLIASAATVSAAVALHPIFLLLLLPLVMAIGYFTFTAQDVDWVRVGAVRRFQGTRLRPPGSWEPVPVDQRIEELGDAAAELEQRLAEAEKAVAGGASDNEDAAATELALSIDLVEAADAYTAALAKAGIEAGSVDQRFSKWLDLVFETYRIGSELSQVKSKRESLSREAEEARDALFRFLVLEDEAPPEGRADSDALRAGLQRVASRAA